MTSDQTCLVQNVAHFLHTAKARVAINGGFYRHKVSALVGSEPLSLRTLSLLPLNSLYFMMAKEREGRLRSFTKHGSH